MLILLVSPPGGGKNFLLPEIEEKYNAITLSADDLREIVTGNAGDQTRNSFVFSTLHLIVESLLKDGHTVLLNNTNYNKKNRKSFISIARKLKKKVLAIHIVAPIEVCKARNLRRTRVLPESVIDNQFAKFEVPNEYEVDEVLTLDNSLDMETADIDLNKISPPKWPEGRQGEFTQ